MQNISSEVDRFIKIKNLLSTFIEKHDFRRVNQYYQVVYQNNLKYIEKYDLPLYEDAVLLRDYDVLFSNFDLNLYSYLQLLNTWRTADEGFLIYILLGDYWADTALQYDVKNPEFDEIRRLFVDISTYWYLKALEKHIDAPDVYIALMNLYAKTEENCDLSKITQHYCFDVSQYSSQALNIFYQQIDELPIIEKVNVVLRAPLPEEKNNPCLYWFNLSIERKVSVMAFASYCSNLLNQYQGNYSEVDGFLYQDVCQKQSHLLLQQIYYLRYMHEFKNIISCLADSFLENKKNAQELIDYFNTLVLTKRQMVDCYVQQILFYRLCLDSKHVEISEKYQIQQKIYQLSQSIVCDYPTEFQSSVHLHDEFLKQLILLFTDTAFPLTDEQQLRAQALSLICMWQYNITSMVLNLALMEQPHWGIYKDPAICFENIWQRKDQYYFNEQLNKAWQYLKLTGEYDALVNMLIQFAEVSHTPSMMYLFEIYSGKDVQGVFDSYKDLNTAQAWLDKALALGDVQARTIQGQRLVEKSLDQTSDQLKKAFASDAMKCLEGVLDRHIVQAEVSYGHARFILQEHLDQTTLLQSYFPMLLEKYQFNKPLLAEIAYIYAFATYYGLGVQTNLYLAYYWSNNAVSLDPTNARYQILYASLIQPTGWFIKKIQYKKRIRVSRENLPIWMKQTIRIFERHLVF